MDNEERAKVADTIEFCAQWLEHNGMTQAASTVRLIKPGQISEEDLRWADEKIKQLAA